MNRRVADWVVALLVAVVLLAGFYTGWQAYQRNRALDGMMGPMMGGSIRDAHGINPLWYVLGTVVTAAIIVGVYVAVRNDLAADQTRQERSADSTSTISEAVPSGSDTTNPSPEPSEGNVTATPPRPPVIDLLPEDERRILEPVLASPGITQIELRDRSEFSKSKVSQTVSGLGKRGLLYRERQGRTYRVYPDDSLTEADSK